jgi:DNA-directed RNA polymerase subunit beta
MEKKDFARSASSIEIPNLLRLQLESFHSFLQFDIPPAERKDQGLQFVFKEVFPIEDVHERFLLEFVHYGFGEPRYYPDEALHKGTTYGVPLKATLRLTRRVRTKSGEVKTKDVIEEDVYLCELPFMTPMGSFIINGVERVVVSQLHRSPGLYLSQEGEEYSALVVPARGIWFELVIDRNGIISAVFDRRRRVPIITFLRALGFSPEESLAHLFSVKTGKPEPGRILAASVTGEGGILYARIGDTLTDDDCTALAEKGVKEIRWVDSKEPGISYLVNTIRVDKTLDEEDALRKLYYRLRSMAPHSLDIARATVLGMLFDPRRFDLGRVGRYKLNARLGIQKALSNSAFQKEDIIGVIKMLLNFSNRQFPPDDMDHLGNRRVKRVGELLENQFRIGLLQLAQNVRERATFVEEAQATPSELVNVRLLSNVVMKFFTTSQLSQFLEQTNPLAELTHKRRVSALGPGGLTREMAGFEVRDIHYSHYGRLCPIETPEGPNIGLISTVATHAQVDEFGFLSTPYRRVKDGVATMEIVHLNADEEERYKIAQSNARLDGKGKFLDPDAVCRYRGDIITLPISEVDFIDVSPKQIFAPSTVLIPFLEHDDADRALMGTNMQRQAVPLLQPERPLVATGVEAKFAQEAGAAIVAESEGTVHAVDASNITVKTKTGLREYKLKKFVKSNQYTCINQIPRVREGQRLKRGDLLADGPAAEGGELALGRNVLAAYLPMRGYNYEDAIIISESLLKDDVFTSIQILEFEIQARETKLGPEEMTRDVPGASEDELANLDEFGIIRLGAEVEPGDVLVGRISPKGEVEFTPEEKLLWAIFGEKATNVKDTSLRVDPGVFGVVIERRILSRKTQDPLARHLEKERLETIAKTFELEQQLINERWEESVQELLLDTQAAKTLADRKGKVVISRGDSFTEDFFSKGKLKRIRTFEGITSDAHKNELILDAAKLKSKELKELSKRQEQETEKVARGDELSHGVLKSVRIFIAQKRKLAVGDKMSGRHGNKGVVAKVLPVEDMPCLADGTPVEIVLNPLGVPSRMNIGQILEAHLGWACKILGYQAICPIFEGGTTDEIKGELKRAGLPEDGKTVLYDGLFGLPFAEKVTVGYIYFMKLIHMVDDKIHARSTGRYSLITQQPLGGKTQMGGQRFGEMEVWALEAYGAAHTLQEMLTIKSDDVEGRSSLYEALVRGKNPPQPKMPASFNVLVKELQGLGLELAPEKERK